MINYDSMFDELEKIALGEAGAEAFSRQVAQAKEQGYRDILHRVEGGPTGSQRYKSVRHTMKEVPFMEGLKRNLTATARRMKNPSKLLSRAKWALTAPTGKGIKAKLPKALAIGGTALTALNALPTQDPSGAGKSRIHRALEGAGGIIGGTAGRGLAGGLVAGTLGSKIGDLAGKGFDKLRGYKPKVRQAGVAE